MISTKPYIHLLCNQSIEPSSSAILFRILHEIADDLAEWMCDLVLVEQMPDVNTSCHHSSPEALA
jgi:hypothetical protein